MTYCVTFGQSHYHPVTKEKLREHWCEVEASSYVEAHEKAREEFGVYFANIFAKKDFESTNQHAWYPKGKYELPVYPSAADPSIFILEEYAKVQGVIPPGCSMSAQEWADYIKTSLMQAASYVPAPNYSFSTIASSLDEFIESCQEENEHSALDTLFANHLKNRK